MDALNKQIKGIRPPRNYFQGRQVDQLGCIDNLIIFVRKSRQELQQRTFENRPHHRYVMVLALETAGTVAINRNRIPLKEKEGLLIQPYQFHQFLDLSDSELLWLIITFEIEDPDYFSLFRDRVFALDVSLQEQLLEIVRIYRKRPGVYTNTEVLLATSLFLTRIKRNLVAALDEETHPLGIQNGPGQDLLSRIDKAMTQEQWNEFPKIPTLARLLGYSESRLRSLFKEHFALSLGSYLRNYQIHTAISLMKNPRRSLTDVAFAAGFSSMSVFSRSFRRHTRSTPRDYRKNMLRIP